MCYLRHVSRGVARVDQFHGAGHRKENVRRMICPKKSGVISSEGLDWLEVLVSHSWLILATDHETDAHRRARIRNEAA